MLELKNVKTAASVSEETLAFRATLYWQGKKVGEASNQGHGDPILYRFDPSVDKDAVDAWCRDYLLGLEHHNYADLADSDLQKWIKRNSKNAVLFRLKGEERGTFHTLKPRSDKAIAQVKAKYGDKIVELH